LRHGGGGVIFQVHGQQGEVHLQDLDRSPCCQLACIHSGFRCMVHRELDHPEHVGEGPVHGGIVRSLECEDDVGSKMVEFFELVQCGRRNVGQGDIDPLNVCIDQLHFTPYELCCPLLCIFMIDDFDPFHQLFCLLDILCTEIEERSDMGICRALLIECVPHHSFDELSSNVYKTTRNLRH